MAKIFRSLWTFEISSTCLVREPSTCIYLSERGRTRCKAYALAYYSRTRAAVLCPCTHATSRRLFLDVTLPVSLLLPLLYTLLPLHCSVTSLGPDVDDALCPDISTPVFMFYLPLGSLEYTRVVVFIHSWHERQRRLSLIRRRRDRAIFLEVRRECLHSNLCGQRDFYTSLLDTRNKELFLQLLWHFLDFGLNQRQGFRHFVCNLKTVEKKKNKHIFILDLNTIWMPIYYIPIYIVFFHPYSH